MLRIPLITAFCALALTLAACAGNGGNKTAARQPEEPAEMAETEEIVQTFRKVPLPADCQGVAFDAYRQMMLAVAEGYDESDKEAFL